ncbi:MAG: LacI family DNA-binding transcriptional regulator [Opitutales bacterium]
MKEPSMQDVAEKSGFHRTTVSRALKDNPRIPAATRFQIQRIAEEMGYRPNPLVSALMTQRSGKKGASAERPVIAYLSWEDEVTYKTFHVPRGFREGARQCANKMGYHLEIFRLFDGKMSARRLGGVLNARGIRAVCVGPLPHERSRLHLPWDGFAAVGIGYTLLHPQLNRVVIHHYHNSFTAMRMLRKAGYRRVGLFLDKSLSNRSDDGWLGGFLVARERHPSHDYPLLLSEKKLQSYETFARWFERNQPDALLVEDTAVESYLSRMGLSVPGDVGLATLDWNPKFSHWSGMDQKADAVGAAAIEVIDGNLRRNEFGKPQVYKNIMIEGRWVNGNTLREMGDG